MITFKPITTQEEWRWIRERARCIACEDSQGIVAICEDGAIGAVAAFDSFTVDACSVHLAIDRPIVLRRGFLSEIAAHLFYACSRKRIFGLVPSNNEKALRLDKHIGFREVTRIPDAMKEGVDYVVMRMDREDCRWLPKIKEVA